MSVRTSALTIVLLTVMASAAFIGAIVVTKGTSPGSAASPEASGPGRRIAASVEPSPSAPPSAAPGADVDAAGVDPAPDPAIAPTSETARPVVLAFAGDVHGEKQIAAALARGERPLADIASALDDADVAVVNLETAVGSSGTKANKQYAFQAPAALLHELDAAGVDVVNLANNHSLDYGHAGLVETLGLVDAAGLAAVGAGRTDHEAYAPLVRDIRGVRVAVIGLTRVWPDRKWAATADRPGLAGAYDVRRAVAAVTEATRTADVVTVVIHWGTESQGCPDEHQLELAAALRTAGADVVVGHHPHVLQGVEHDDGQLVAYSLGNFLWYTAGKTSRLTGVLRVEVAPHGVTGWELVPAVVSPVDGGPRPANAADAREIAERVNRLVPGDLCPASLP